MELADSSAAGRNGMDTARIKKIDPVTGKKVIDRKPIVLGSTSKRTKTQARELLAREIAKRKGWFKSNSQVMNDGAVTFGWFVRNRYFPLKEGDWKEETAKNKKGLIQANLLGDLSEIPLLNFDRFTSPVAREQTREDLR